MRYRICKKRHIEEQPDQDVYFWDGEVCVTSRVITISNPATTTIAVSSLHGVDVKFHESALSLGPIVLALILGALAFVTWAISPILGATVAVMAASVLIFNFEPDRYDINLRTPGDGHVFTTREKRWADRFAESVGQAIAGRGQGGGGDSHVPPAAILPDPVLSRN